MSGFEIPSAYRDGYERAVVFDPALAQDYVEQTVVGDPPADAVIDSLVRLDGREIARFMNAGVDRDTQVLAEAPRAVGDFFDYLDSPPPWFDHDALLPGRHVVREHLDLFIIGFIVVSLRNFNSLMSKVFFMTGQFTTEQGLRTIRNNIRYLTEMLMDEGSLDRQGLGWKFSIRIRLVHARIRRQLLRSGRWDQTVFGTPISAANMGLASANFSASLIRDVERLGADLNADSRCALMQIWRYASWLMGTPEVLLRDGCEVETARVSQIAHLCEPPPNAITVEITNATVRALPEVAMLTDTAAKQAMVDHGYRIARALLGGELSNQFGFPPQWVAGFLPWMRCKYRLRKVARRLTPGVERIWKEDPFVLLLDAANLDDRRARPPTNREEASPSNAASQRRA